MLGAHMGLPTLFESTGFQSGFLTLCLMIGYQRSPTFILVPSSLGRVRVWFSLPLLSLF